MRLYLVQHGQAKPESEDPDRPLTQKGLSDVKKVSAFLKNAELNIGTIWHSGKTRALQTAEILAVNIGIKDIVEHKHLAPNDDIRPIKDELLRSKSDLMIAGHLPFLGKLASSLLSGDGSDDMVSFQQGGVVCLEKAEDKAWSLRWMIVPELLP